MVTDEPHSAACTCNHLGYRQIGRRRSGRPYHVSWRTERARAGSAPDYAVLLQGSPVSLPDTIEFSRSGAGMTVRGHVAILF